MSNISRAFLIFLIIWALIFALAAPACFAALPYKKISVGDFINKSRGLPPEQEDEVIEYLRKSLIERFLKLKDYKRNYVWTETVYDAQIMITGIINDYTIYTTDIIVGDGFKNLETMTIEKAAAEITISVHLVDIVTMGILDISKIKGTAEKESVFPGFENSPAGRACKDATFLIYEYVREKINEIPWQGIIMDVSGDEIKLPVGYNVAVDIGDRFDVFRMGEENYDRITRRPLGRTLHFRGTVEVVQSQELYSIAKPKYGSDFAKGDLVKLMTGAYQMHRNLGKW